MLYRIQTLYLIFALAVSFFSATYHFTEVTDLELIKGISLQKYPFVFSGAFSFLSLLFFKKRLLQIKLIFFNIFTNVGALLTFLYLFFYQKPSPDCIYLICISVALILFLLLAKRAVGKDELLIKSADRIR